jgi:DNA replication factor GINS
MNLDELQSVQSRERQTDQLQQLRATFYEEAGEFVAQLREERERAAERADDPFDSPEVNRLSDDIKTAEQTVEAIYERRVGKLVKRASLAAAGVPTDETGLTEEEQALFADLVERIEAHRATVLDVLDAGSAAEAAGGADLDEARPSDSSASTDRPAPGTVNSEGSPAADPDPEPADDAPPDPAPDGGASAPVVGAAESAADPTDDRVTLRITADVGEIYGVDDRVYTLGDEDVVTLPSANAEPLLERGAAQRVE